MGLEREIHRRWGAGLRTHMLVAIGAALFVLAGDSLTHHSTEATTRIVQGIAAGIGFIGAGTILKLTERQEVKGLTTAGSLWLAAGVGIFATLTSFIAALVHGSLELAMVTAPLAGALLGFLRYNFNPASIFLGDSGSLLIGFLLGGCGT